MKKNTKIRFNDFYNRIGYTFQNQELVQLALTHPSFSNENGAAKTDNNQRLEYLGDAVLGLVIGEALFQSLTNVDEGELSRLRSRLVCEDTLYMLAHKLGFEEFMLFGKCAAVLHPREAKGALADAYEAVIAAIYLDSGLEAARQYILAHHAPFLADPDGDWLKSDMKSKLQVMAQKDHKLVRYDVEQLDPANPMSGFHASVFVDDVFYGDGTGGSKQEAQQQAAAKAVAALRS